MDILEDFAIPENDGALHRLKNIVLILIGITFIWFSGLELYTILNKESSLESGDIYFILGVTAFHFLQGFLIYKRKRLGWIIVAGFNLLNINYLLLSVLWKMYERYDLQLYQLNWWILIYLVHAGICIILLPDRMMHYFKIKPISRAVVIAITSLIMLIVMVFKIISHWPLAL